MQAKEHKECLFLRVYPLINQKKHSKSKHRLLTKLNMSFIGEMDQGRKILKLK